MNWYYSKDDEKSDPISLDELHQLLNNGSLSPDTLVWREGMSDWQAAKDVNELTIGSPTTSATSAPVPLPGVQTVFIPTYMWQAICCTILCFPILGIIAIVYSSQVNTFIMQGNFREAEESSRKAKVLCWWAFGVGLTLSVGVVLFYMLIIMLGFIGAAAGM